MSCINVSSEMEKSFRENFCNFSRNCCIFFSCVIPNHLRFSFRKFIQFCERTYLSCILLYPLHKINGYRYTELTCPVFYCIHCIRSTVSGYRTHLSCILLYPLHKINCIWIQNLPVLYSAVSIA